MIRISFLSKLFWIGFASLFYKLDSFGQESLKNRFNEISSFYRSHPDSAFRCLEPFFTHPEDTVKATALNLAGNCFYFQSEYDTAIKFFERSLSYYPKHGFETSIAKNYNNLGVCHFFLGNYQKAYDFHHLARQIRERLNDPQISSTYNNLGLVMNELGNTKGALAYYNLSLSSKIKYAQFNSLSTTLTNIANCHRNIGNIDSAIYFETLNFKHLDSLPDQRNLSDCLNNLGSHYLSKNDYQKSIYFSQLALQIEKDLKADFGVINSCSNIANSYLALRNPILAKDYADSAFYLIEEADSYRNIPEVYLIKARADSALGMYAEAFNSMRRYIILRDKFDSENSNKAVLDLEKKYQTELREKEIEQLKQVSLIQDLKVEQSKQLQWTLSIISVLLFLGVAFYFRQYRYKKRNAEILSVQKLKLEELNEFKNKLFAIISHDLRNPVHAFHHLSTSLKENWQYASTEELGEFIQSLSDSSEELKMLLGNLLQWSMVQIDRMPINMERFDLHSLIEEIKKELHFMTLEHKMEIHLLVSSDFYLVSDKGMVQVILRNLISNAIKFTTAGKVVLVKADCLNNEVVIQIIDEGPGLSEHDIALLLQGNNDTKKIGSSYKKGAGIGLLLCKDLIAKLNGRLEINSILGQGCTFSVIFPMNEPTD